MRRLMLATPLLLLAAAPAIAVRGDANGDGCVDISDPIFILSFVYQGGPAPVYLEQGDADGNARIEAADANFLLTYLYEGGPAPAPAYGATPFAPIRSCASNLAQLWRALQSYKTRYGVLPHDTGGAFWLRLSQVSPPIVPAGSPLYDCPVTWYAPAMGATEYRGPARDANNLGARDAIGADGVWNHGGYGHVLLKDGTILHCTSWDPYWIAASVTTSP